MPLNPDTIPQTLVKENNNDHTLLHAQSVSTSSRIASKDNNGK